MSWMIEDGDERQQVGKTFESKSDSSVGGFKKTFGKTEGGKSDFRQGRTSTRKSSSSQTTHHKKSGR